MSYILPEIIYFGLFTGAMILFNYDNETDNTNIDTEELINNIQNNIQNNNNHKIIKSKKKIYNDDTFLETDIDSTNSTESSFYKSYNNKDFRIFDDTDPFESRKNKNIHK